MGNDYNRNGSFNQNKRHDYGQKQQDEIPNPVKIDSFYDSNRNVKNDLFDETAKKAAKTLGNSYNGVSATQLRRFFDEVKRYDRLLGMQSQSWEKQEPYIRMLKSKIAYSVTRKQKDRKNAGYYKNLSSFLSSCIDCVKSAEDYHIFVSLFEAVYGFYYELAPDRNK